MDGGSSEVRPQPSLFFVRVLVPYLLLGGSFTSGWRRGSSGLKLTSFGVRPNPRLLRDYERRPAGGGWLVGGEGEKLGLSFLIPLQT